MHGRRRFLLTALLTAGFGRVASAFRIEPAPSHIVAAHGSALAAREHHAAIVAAARAELIARGDDPAEVDALIGETRCPHCGARALTE